MGIKRIDVVAYHYEVKQNYSFTGGHRHRYFVIQHDIHILFPADRIEIDIEAVKPATPPKRRHDKRN
jgi:hypothetical protein